MFFSRTQFPQNRYFFFNICLMAENIGTVRGCVYIFYFIYNLFAPETFCGIVFVSLLMTVTLVVIERKL